MTKPGNLTFQKLAATQNYSLAAARFNAIGSGNYETMRLQSILGQTRPHDGLDTGLLRQIVSTILIYPNGTVNLKLKTVKL